MERGYYEQILDAGQTLGAPLPTSLAGRKGGPNLVCEAVADLREVVLMPSLRVIQPVGASWSTNAQGMRDDAYPRAKPPGTFRIALAGDSIGAGWGVGDGAGFEPRLERSLAERSRVAGGPAVEILNFSVPGRSPGQRWYHFTQLAWDTEPDLVVFEATQADVAWDRRRLARLLARGIGWDSPLYARVLDAVGVQPGDSVETYAQALQPYDWELTAEVYRHVAADCRARGVPSVWLLLPRVGRPVEPADHQRLVSLAREAGFTSLVDLSDSFDGLDPSTLTARSDDYHPNARGHALLAARLNQALLQVPSLRFPWEVAPAPPLAFEEPDAP
jgi:lysophospholipase L1-like esterase